jgi:hypothetical protein
VLEEEVVEDYRKSMIFVAFGCGQRYPEKRWD